MLPGTIPSKKNNQIAVTDLTKAQQFMAQLFQRKEPDEGATIDECRQMLDLVKGRIVPSNSFRKWHAGALEDIRIQRNRYTDFVLSKGLNFPLSDCSLKVYNYFTNTRRMDLTNKVLSIEDLFVDAAIMIDDDWLHNAPVLTDGDQYKDEMSQQATVIHLTAFY